MKLSDFPPIAVRDALWVVLDRYAATKERWPPYHGIKTEWHLTIDEARLIYAGGQWLSRYNDWVREAEKSGGKVGVYPAEHDLNDCTNFLKDRVKSFDKAEPRMILTGKNMAMIGSCAAHLDHYQMILSHNDEKKKHWKGKRP